MICNLFDPPCCITTKDSNGPHSYGTSGHPISDHFPRLSIQLLCEDKVLYLYAIGGAYSTVSPEEGPELQQTQWHLPRKSVA
jgi:hypothetical protein